MHPILLTINQFKIFGGAIGPLHIYTYGTMLVIGFLSGMFLAVKRARSKNISKDDILDLTFYMLIGGIFGARISYVLIHLVYYSKHFAEIFNLSAGGLSWHGGLIAAIIIIFVFCRAKKINIGGLFDCIAPSFPLGQAIGRLGCFLNGCCGGKIAAGIFGTYICKIKIFNGHHPAQIYELILDLFIFIFILIYEKHIKFKGELFLTYLAIYSIMRFFIEFLRDNVSESPIIMIGNLSLGQYISIIILIPTLLWIITGRKNAKQK